ncbi:MAG: 30S ribosomal protein S17 [Planctomycetota bacterium]|nr:30S ribosomal protein S17 [Planctomycetota bacterium]MDI6786911.1 30S ribosomal protein S17 [Planctomycetota bacterium]
MTNNAVAEQKTGRRRLIAVVVKNNSAKTITVSFKRLVKYPKYGKYIHKFSTYKVHDEKNEAKVGDKVEIIESRPISRSKRWCLLKVVTPKVMPEADPVGIRGDGVTL